MQNNDEAWKEHGLNWIFGRVPQVIAPIAAITLLAGQLAAQDTADLEARFREMRDAGRWGEARDLGRALLPDLEGDARKTLLYTNELANLDQRLGDFDRAALGYEACLELVGAVLGPGSRAESQLQNNLASLQITLGNFETAETLLRTALASLESSHGAGALEAVPTRNNLANLLWCIGDLEQAEVLFREALETRIANPGQDPLDTARSRANLGGLLFYRDRIDEAEPLVRAALAVFEREAGPEHPETLEVLLFLGEIERARERPGAALPLYRRVLAGRESAFGGRPHAETAEALRRIGDALRESGSPAEALVHYRRSDEIYRAVLPASHPDRIEGLFGAGLAALALGDRDSALEMAETCAQIEFATFEAMLEFTDERQRLAYQDLFRSQHLLANLGDGAAVEDFLLRSKGVVLDSLVDEARLARRADETPVLRELSGRVASARAKFRAAFLAGDEETADEALEELRARKAELIGRAGLEAFRTRGFEASLPDLQSSLRDGEALVDYLRYDRHEGGGPPESRYGAAVITNRSVGFHDCASAAEIDALVAELIPYFGHPENPDDALSEELLTTLHRQLVAPFADRLGESGSIRICPAGSISFVPFPCLLDGEGRFLVEKHDIEMLSSAREAIEAPGVPPGDGALLVGDPDFSAAPGKVSANSGTRGLLASVGAAGLAAIAEDLTPLAGTREEVEALEGMLESAGIATESLAGTKASEERLRSEAKRPQILHFATHGMYLPSRLPPPSERNLDLPGVPDEVAGFQNPLFGSWIALSGAASTVGAWSRNEAPDPADDGILMANEAAELDLDGTLIVALSACETASGEATGGDGVLGIRRGFRLAGAENVLTTLWPISDAMTVTLMKDFYGSLLEAESPVPSAALSRVQRHWLAKIRDDPEAVLLPTNNGRSVPVGGLYWSVNLAGPFLLGR